MLRKTGGYHRFALAIVSASCLLMPVDGAAWGQWEQIHKLTAADAAEKDYFGRSVSVSGDIIVVGADYDDDGSSAAGSVYVFDARTGQELIKLRAEDSGILDRFGFSASICGNTAVIGAVGDNGVDSDSGAAYVFDVTTGEQLHKLTAAEAAAYDNFGYAVAISGDTVVVGAPYDDVDYVDCGAAYVFDAMTGGQIHMLTTEYLGSEEHFGCSVSVSSNIIVVGARQADYAGSGSGAVFVYDATTGQQLHRLTAEDADFYDKFGCSVSVSGNTIVIGAYGDDNVAYNSGAAYVFDALTGEQVHKLIADDAAWGDEFGRSVGIDGNTIVVGTYYDDDGSSNSGSAYLFDAITGEQLCRLTADDANEEDYFGYSVSVSEDVIVVGAVYDDVAGIDSGSAYVFQQSESCPADVNFDGKVNIDDIFAVLGAWGTCDDCPEDINDDGKVNIDDLFEILGAWGPCPERSDK